MLEYYRENLKFSLKTLWYVYKVYFIFALILFVFMGIGLFLLAKIQPDTLNIAIFSAIAIPLFAIFAVFLAFVWRFIYISGYSVGKELQESSQAWHIFYAIYGKLTDWRVVSILLILFFLSITVGSLFYLYAIPESAALDVGTRVGLTLFVYFVILLIILLVTPIYRLLKKVLLFLVRAVGILLVAVLVIGSQAAILAGIYRYIVPLILSR